MCGDRREKEREGGESCKRERGERGGGQEESKAGGREGEMYSTPNKIKAEKIGSMFTYKFPSLIRCIV